tara:strand:- start:387 stop:578 length:192 start_codon:yes stop_codon:yes gene_type:complete
MSNIKLNANIKNCDDFYSKLIAAHENLTDEESEVFNSRLILILANQVGDEKILETAIEMAKER